MTTAAEKAAARRKKARAQADKGSGTAAPATPAGEPKKALPTTKLYPKRVPLEVSPEAHERLRRLSYELDRPVNAIIRALIDSTSDHDMKAILNTN